MYTLSLALVQKVGPVIPYHFGLNRSECDLLEYLFLMRRVPRIFPVVTFSVIAQPVFLLGFTTMHACIPSRSQLQDQSNLLARNNL